MFVSDCRKFAKSPKWSTIHYLVISTNGRNLKTLDQAGKPGISSVARNDICLSVVQDALKIAGSTLFHDIKNDFPYLGGLGE